MCDETLDATWRYARWFTKGSRLPESVEEDVWNATSRLRLEMVSGVGTPSACATPGVFQGEVLSSSRYCTLLENYGSSCEYALR